MENFLKNWVILLFAVALLSACGGGGGGSVGSNIKIPVPGTGEGSLAAPKPLGTAPISYTGAIGAFAESYYTFRTGSSSVMYTISLTNMQTNLSWHLFPSASFSTPIKNCDNSDLNLDEICTTSIALNADTDYNLIVDNYWNNEGSTYSLSISVTPVPAAPVINATPGHLQNIITWAAVPDAVRYTVYSSTSSSVSKISFANKYTYATSPYIHSGVSAGVIYYYVVTAENTNGESAESGVKSATPLPALTSLSANFDDGTLQGWTASGTWGVTTAASQSVNYSVTDSPAGNYGTYANMKLTSPVLDLVSSSTPTLSFYHKYDIESGGSNDHGYIDISTDGGLIWTLGVVSYQGVQSTFTQVNFSLSAYKSDKVVVRFRFGSDFSDTVPHDGWYLDNIVIQ